jgi:pSer/pThr/pTyr-binding forkhead associated (FHA) protein
MRDGWTRKLEIPERDETFERFIEKWRATVVIVSGAAAGTEYAVDRSVLTLGRGPGVHWAFDDSTMSKEHAALEFTDGGIRIRDLGSMNGIFLNGSEVKAGELKNGDRFQIGEHVLQFVLEKRPKEPKTYVLSDD